VLVDEGAITRDAALAGLEPALLQCYEQLTQLHPKAN
jgi:hypothetical protein